ncbi:MAG: hypothetical protein HRT71_01140 [Flavobacteriales bacterium]|nr:hypothetical protein [Flavobacteriales bacterium]
MIPLGYYDSFIKKLDPNGTLIWAKSKNGIGPVTSSSIAVDNDGNIITTGSFEESIDFDSNTGTNNSTYLSYGVEDIYVQKLSDCNTAPYSIIQNDWELTANVENVVSYQWIDCNNGNSVLIGGTTQFYTASDYGSYAVIIEQYDNCTETTECVLLSAAGVDELDETPKLIVYPNPTQKDVNVVLEKHYQSISTRLFNSNGQLMDVASFRNVDHFNIEITG